MERPADSNRIPAFVARYSVLLSYGPIQKLRSQGSNLESLGPKPSVLPITPLRNGGWGRHRTDCLWSFTPALFQMSFPTVPRESRMRIENRGSRIRLPPMSGCPDCPLSSILYLRSSIFDTSRQSCGGRIRTSNISGNNRAPCRLDDATIFQTSSGSRPNRTAHLTVMSGALCLLSYRAFPPATTDDRRPSAVVRRLSSSKSLMRESNAPPHATERVLRLSEFAGKWAG
jgi:hypothetical protein